MPTTTATAMATQTEERGACPRCQGKGYGSWRIMDGQCLMCGGSGLKGMNPRQSQWWLAMYREVMAVGARQSRLMNRLNPATSPTYHEKWQECWDQSNTPELKAQAEKLAAKAFEAYEKLGGKKAKWVPNPEFPRETWTVPDITQWTMDVLLRVATLVYNQTHPKEQR